MSEGKSFHIHVQCIPCDTLVSSCRPSVCPSVTLYIVALRVDVQG